MFTDCMCGHSEEEHFVDFNNPGSASCNECPCVHYDRDKSDDTDAAAQKPKCSYCWGSGIVHGEQCVACAGKGWSR